MSLYLKYRPQTIDELDLTSVRKTLGDMVAANSVGHAYLLTGPRGAGKTSTARVLARIVNCEHNSSKLGEPCNTCPACTSILSGSAVDVIEIDAASNRGIDDIRELKEKIRLAPASLARKVYIIDEVHMLTTEAFNALLKTLEEPPTHSLFILCTTELHKVPETIVSRCVQIQFTKATPEEMQRSFARVVAGEGKKVSAQALAYLAQAVDGSFRDGVKILDQVLANSSDVGMAEIEAIIAGSAGFSVRPFVSALVERDAALALLKLSEALNSGVDTTYLLVSSMRCLRDSLLAQYGVGENPLNVTVNAEVAPLIYSLDEVARKLSTSLDGELLIQTAVIEWCGQATVQSSGAQGPTKPAKSSSSTVAPAMGSTKKISVAAHEAVTAEATLTSPQASPMTTDSSDIWKKVVGGLGQNNMALDTILSKATPGNIHGDELTVYVQYDFHKQQLMSEKNRAKFEEMISLAVGRPMRVNCEVRSKSDTIVAKTPEFSEDLVSQAQEIFTS